MKFYELCEICNFHDDPKIYVVREDLPEKSIEWDCTVSKYVSNDYKYIYNEDEDIIGVNAEIVISEDKLQNAEILEMDIGRWVSRATIRVRL